VAAVNGDPQETSHCKLTILGDNEGTLQQASMVCTGTPTGTLFLNVTHLGSFLDNFAGVDLVNSCDSPMTDGAPCLITICSGSIVLRDSSVSWVRGVPLKGLLCVVHDSKLELYNSTFDSNQVRPLLVGDQARVVLHASNVVNNLVNGSGAGLWVEGNATVVTLANSSVCNNTAVQSGGGLFTRDTAKVAFSNSTVSNNTALGGAGGGLQAWDNATVTLTGGSSVVGNTANTSGGGVFAADGSQVTIADSSVCNNTAVQSGGGLFTRDTAKVAFSNSTVSNNTALKAGGGLAVWDNCTVTMSGGSTVHGNTANARGGGLIIGDAAQLIITNSSVLNNTARDGGGGGVYARDTSNMLVDGSSAVSNNVAWGFGGGVYANDNTTVVLTGGTHVQGNTASESGGGLFAGRNADFTITNSSVHSNAAGYGGGLFAQDTAKVAFSNSTVSNNTALGGGGGGLQAWDNATVYLTGGSSVHHNLANTSGGGVYAGRNAVITVTNSRVQDNRANLHGGGLYSQDHAQVTITSSRVQYNDAQGCSGGVFAKDGSKVTLNNGSLHGNVAHVNGGGLCAYGTARIAIANGSHVSNNTAAGVGGGMNVRANASLTMIGGSSVHGNAANDSGGGVFAGDRVVVSIDNATICNNSAPLGGGLSAIDDAKVAIFSSSICGNVGRTAAGGILSQNKATLLVVNSHVDNNQALNGSAGGMLLSGATVSIVRDGCSIANNSCVSGVGGGIAVGLLGEGLRFNSIGRLEGDTATGGRGDSDARLVISNSRITHNTNLGGAGGGLAATSKSTLSLTDGTTVQSNNAANSSGGAVMVMGNASFEADGTVLFDSNSVPRGFVGSTLVAFDNSIISLPIHGSLTKCSGGVYLGRTPCGVGEFLQHDVCVCCPPHTFSFDNSNCSSCPANADCLGANIVQPLPGFWSSSNTSIQMHRCPLFKTACDYIDEGHMCKPGYRGTLCGDCQLPEYGMLSPMRCGKCMQPKVQLGLYLFLSSMTTSFVTYTVHATWQENLQGGRSVLVTDIIKVLVQFLQYIVIIGSVSVPWPLFDVQQWLQAIGHVVTMGSGQALSLDCWLYHYAGQTMLPLAIQRQLVLFLAPVCMLLVVVLLQWLSWVVVCKLVPLFRQPREGAGSIPPRRSQSQGAGSWVLLRKLPVTVMVLVYYAFPTLLRAALSFFACLKVDEPLSALTGVPVGVTATLTHRWGYWVSAIEQQCFSGYHLRWALGLGLPSVLLWCVVVPVALGVGLYMCRNRADSETFREHFGFLYRTYRPECMWWEAVWAARTVLLTLISVFSFPMQRYYSVLSLLLVFWASAALQTVFRPYAVSTLHRMHLVSTSCLAATTLGALAMFAYDIQESTAYALRIAITVLVFVVNVAFVGWCCLKLAPALKAKVGAIFGTVKKWGLRGVQRVSACIGVPISVGHTVAHGLGSAGQHSEADKDPSSLAPVERV
jgi:hypothetical protein